MTTVAALGEGALVEGFALAGAVVFGADDDAAVDRAWEALPGDVAVLILTPRAAARLRPRFAERPSLLVTVGPE